MFHGECCMKHGVPVAAGNFHIRELNYLISFCAYFSMLHQHIFNVADILFQASDGKFSIGCPDASKPVCVNLIFRMFYFICCIGPVKTSFWPELVRKLVPKQDKRST